MRAEETRNELGVVKIHENVIASISAHAASEIEGVKRVGRVKEGFMDLFKQKNAGPIKVEINKNEEVLVNLPLIITYGYNIPEVSARVQENVRLALEKMSNLSIKEININVQGIERG